MKTTGIYETFRSASGVYVLLPEHQQRLNRSCQQIGVKAPDLSELVKSYTEVDQRLRVEVNLEGEVSVTDEVIEPWAGSFLYPETWRVKVVEGERVHPELKSTDTDFQREEREKAHEEGYDEILLVNREGLVTEGGITNVFLVEGDHLVTPAHDVLPGIARALVIWVAGELGIEVVQRDVKREELDHFDGLFLTNSIRGIITTGPIPPLVRKIADGCTQFIQQRIDAAKKH